MRQRRFHPAIIIFSLSLSLFISLQQKTFDYFCTFYIFFLLFVVLPGGLHRSGNVGSDRHTHTDNRLRISSVKEVARIKANIQKKKTNKSSNAHKRNIFKKFQNQIKSPSMIYFDLEYQIQSLIQFLFFCFDSRIN